MKQAYRPIYKSQFQELEHRVWIYVKGYKDRPIVRKISVKCHHAFVILFGLWQSLHHRMYLLFSAMHAAYRCIANACKWIEILCLVWTDVE